MATVNDEPTGDTPGVKYATFTGWIDTYTRVFRGEIWAADDPIVRTHPEWFSDSPAEFVRRSPNADAPAVPSLPSPTRAVETATADPGRPRNVKR